MPLIPWDDEPRTFRTDAPDIRSQPVGNEEPRGVRDTFLGGITALIEGDETPGPKPSYGETLGAAFRQDNLVGSIIANRDAAAVDRYRIEEGFDPYDEIAGTDFESRPELFADVFNRRAFESRKAQIRMEDEDRRILRSGGAFGLLAELGASVADPTILLPGGTVAKGVRGGYAVGKSLLSGAAAGALASSASEAGLHATQATRTGAESAFAIGGSAILGGLIGAGAAAFLSRAERKALSAQMDEVLRTDVPNAQFENEGAVASLFADAGAAARPVESLEDLTIAGKAAGAVGKASAWMRLNPLVRLLESPSTEARSIATGLFENPVYLRKNVDGIASDAAVETLVKEYTQGAVAKAVEETRAQYLAYRRAGGPLRENEFRQAVGLAMRRGDRAISQSGMQHIDAAARAWRSAVFDPLKEQAIARGLLPADVNVSTAESYLSRLWNWRRLEAEEGRFKDITRAWVNRTLAREEPGSSEKFTSAADRDAYVDEIVDEVFNRLTGRVDGGEIPRDIVPTTRGPLKERTFNIPDRLVEDFLESDVELVGRRYARVMSADIELANKFGAPDMRDALRRVQDQYTELRRAAPANAETLGAREKRDMRDLKAIRDMVRGTYRAQENASVGARAFAVANTFNYIRALGGVVLSSAADVARPIMVHGLSRYMADGIVPLVRNLKAVKLSVKEARLAGSVAERVLQTRMATWAEIADPYSVGSPFERFMQNIGRGFSRATFMPVWNDFMKSFSSLLTQTRILDDVEKFASIKKTERAYLAYLGIDEGMAERIAREFKAHGFTDDGVRVANTEDWTDVAARRAYRAAVNKDVDSIIVTKGVADVPLLAHTALGRTALQFKSFALASHQRAFMRGLQAAELGVDGGRAAQLAGVMSATTIGMLIYWLKSVEANRTDDISDNPGRWIAEGVDRSGLFAVAFEANNTIEKYFGIGGYGALQAMFPEHDQGGKASRYASRNTSAAFTGATGGLIEDVVRVANALKRGDLTEGDVSAISRLTPFSTLPGIRSLMKYEVEPAAKQAVR